MKKTILLVGCGHLGRAMLCAWLDAHMGHDIVAIDPKATRLSADFTGRAHFTDDPQKILTFVDSIDAIVVAVKPQKSKEILPLYRRIVQSHTLVLSVMAGVTSGKIASLLDRDCAQLPVIRAMPNLPSAIGMGIAGVFASTATSPAQKTLAEKLLSALGQIVWCDAESDLDVVTGLSAGGPAYVFALCQAMADAGTALGLAPDVARQLARQTIVGAAAYMEKTGIDAQALTQQVATSGGTTAAALAVLNADNVWIDLMRRAIAAAAARAKTIAAE